MKIGVDMLPLKNDSFNRGIGKYTFNLIKTLIKMDDDNKYYLYNVPNELHTHFIKDNTTIYLKEPSLHEANDLDAFIITSLFELGIDYILIPAKMTCKTILIFYDLIPVLFWENYINVLSKETKDEYFRRLSYVKDFDLILAISKTTKKDLVDLLEISKQKIKVIYGGLDEIFLIDKSHEKEIVTVKARYYITGKFLLSTPGIDFRKNIPRMFEAYQCLSEEFKKKLFFVLVCKLQTNEEKHLRKIWADLELPSNRLILTNYIPTSDLITLYDAAEVFIFPSLYEGFGLPVLEALSRGCPVITSNTSSLPEVCENTAIYVNPSNSHEIALAVEEIVKNEYLKNKLIELGLEQFKKFNWNRVVLEVKESFELFMCEQREENIPRYKIAFFTPLNPIKSGISDYSEDILPFLNEFVDIDIFIDEGYSSCNDSVKKLFNIYSHNSFKKMHSKYSLCIYQLGNSEYHEYMIDYILKYPGIIVLHDLTLHGLIRVICNTRGLFDRKRYLDYLFANHGYVEYLEANKNIDIYYHQNNYNLSINFTSQLLNQSLLALVHSNFAKSFIENQVSFCEIWKINMGFPSYNSTIEYKNKLKRELGFSNKIVISTFGRITHTKRIDVLLRSFSKLIKEKKVTNAHLLLVGDLCSDVKEDILKIIDEEDLKYDVSLTGHTSNEDFNKYFEITDVCVNLRYPTSGETSATLIKSLSHRIPTIITNYAQYKEYPDNCCWKVDLDRYETDLLSEYLYALITNNKLRTKMSNNAYEFAEKNNSLQQIVQQYIMAIDYAVKRKRNL